MNPPLVKTYFNQVHFVHFTVEKIIEMHCLCLLVEKPWAYINV